MALLFIAILAYLQIGRVIALSHQQRSAIERPFYLSQPNGYLVHLVLWPLEARPYRFIWFVTTFLFTFVLFILSASLLEYLTKLTFFWVVGLLFISFTPATTLFLSLNFAFSRLRFSVCRFPSHFLEAIYQKAINRKQVNTFVLDTSPAIKMNTLLNPWKFLPGNQNNKKVFVLISKIYFFADSITWLSAFAEGKAGEQDAVSYANSMVIFSRE